MPELDDAGSLPKALQCDRATNGAEISVIVHVLAVTFSFNVTAPRMARKSCWAETKQGQGENE